MKIRTNAASGQWITASNAYEKIIATAATGAIRDVAKKGRDGGRKAITAAGFSDKFANSLQVKFFPAHGVSLDPSAYVHTTINYADVFEKGATINAKTFLWMPLPTVPPIAGRPHMTPKQYIQNVGKLVLMLRPGKPPMLGARVKISSPKPQPFGRFVSKQILKRGTSSSRGEFQTIPLFVGVPTVSIPKKFDVTAAVESAFKNIGQFYLDHFVPYEGRR